MWSEKCEGNFEEGTRFSTRNFDRELTIQTFESVGFKNIEKEGS